MSLAWLRLWTDMPTDPKFRTVAKKSEQPLAACIALYVVFLTNAATRPFDESLPPGAVLIDDEDAASTLDMTVEAVQTIRAAMQGRLLDGNVLTGWGRRQMPAENRAAERARAWRARQAAFRAQASSKSSQDQEIPAAPGPTKTPQTDARTTTAPAPTPAPAAPAAETQEVPVLVLESSVPCPKPRKSRVPVADILAPLVPGLDTQAWAKWVEYRKERKKSISPMSALAMQKKFVAFGDQQFAVVMQSIEQGWTGLFPVKDQSGTKSTLQANIENSDEWARRLIAQNLQRSDPPVSTTPNGHTHDNPRRPQ